MIPVYSTFVIYNLHIDLPFLVCFRVGPRRPAADWTAGRSIENYIRQVAPKPFWNGQLDYALITHFHEDHYGDLRNNTRSKPSKTGKVTSWTKL